MPQLVSNALEILDQEIPKLRAKIDSVHLCFTTDPFMYGYDEIKDMSLAAIRKLNQAGVKCTVLTKGLIPTELVGLSAENEYGITLVSLDEEYRQRIEPGAAPYLERIEALRNLHNKGLKTWVSIEPYPTPNLIEQDINNILNAVAFTDKVIFGRTNYNKEVTAFKNHKVFYNEQAEIVMSFCKKNNKAFHIKQGTIT